MVILTGIRWYLIVVLICSSVIISSWTLFHGPVGHLYVFYGMYVLSILPIFSLDYFYFFNLLFYWFFSELHYFLPSVHCRFYFFLLFLVFLGVRLFNSDFSCFWRTACIIMNFPLRELLLLHPRDFVWLSLHCQLSQDIFSVPFWFHHDPLFF